MEVNSQTNFTVFKSKQYQSHFDKLSSQEYYNWTKNAIQNNAFSFLKWNEL